MVADPVVDHAYIGREVGRAGGAVGVVEEQGAVHADQAASGQRPVHDIVMLLSRRHVIYVLAVVFAANGFPHADELLGLEVYTICADSQHNNM